MAIEETQQRPWYMVYDKKREKWIDRRKYEFDKETNSFYLRETPWIFWLKVVVAFLIGVSLIVGLIFGVKACNDNKNSDSKITSGNGDQPGGDKPGGGTIVQKIPVERLFVVGSKTEDTTSTNKDNITEVYEDKADNDQLSIRLPEGWEYKTCSATHSGARQWIPVSDPDANEKELITKDKDGNDLLIVKCDPDSKKDEMAGQDKVDVPTQTNFFLPLDLRTPSTDLPTDFNPQLGNLKDLTGDPAYAARGVEVLNAVKDLVDKGRMTSQEAAWIYMSFSGIRTTTESLSNANLENLDGLYNSTPNPYYKDTVVTKNGLSCSSIPSPSIIGNHGGDNFEFRNIALTDVGYKKPGISGDGPDKPMQDWNDKIMIYKETSIGYSLAEKISKTDYTNLTPKTFDRYIIYEQEPVTAADGTTTTVNKPHLYNKTSDITASSLDTSVSPSPYCLTTQKPNSIIIPKYWPYQYSNGVYDMDKNDPDNHTSLSILNTTLNEDNILSIVDSLEDSSDRKFFPFTTKYWADENIKHEYIKSLIDYFYPLKTTTDKSHIEDYNEMSQFLTNPNEASWTDEMKGLFNSIAEEYNSIPSGTTPPDYVLEIMYNQFATLWFNLVSGNHNFSKDQLRELVLKGSSTVGSNLYEFGDAKKEDFIERIKIMLMSLFTSNSDLIDENPLGNIHVGNVESPIFKNNEKFKEKTEITQTDKDNITKHYVSYLYQTKHELITYEKLNTNPMLSGINSEYRKKWTPEMKNNFNAVYNSINLDPTTGDITEADFTSIVFPSFWKIWHAMTTAGTPNNQHDMSALIKDGKGLAYATNINDYIWLNQSNSEIKIIDRLNLLMTSLFIGDRDIIDNNIMGKIKYNTVAPTTPPTSPSYSIMDIFNPGTPGFLNPNNDSDWTTAQAALKTP